MKTFIFRACLTGSLLLALAASILWWRSWRICEGVKWVRNDGSQRELVSYAGGIILSETRPGPIPVFPSQPRTERHRIYEPTAAGMQPTWRSRIPGGASIEVVWESAGVIAASGQAPSLVSAPITMTGGSTIIYGGSTVTNLPLLNDSSSGTTIVELDEDATKASAAMPGTSLQPLIASGALQPIRTNRSPVTLTSGAITFTTTWPILYQVVKVPYWLVIALCGLLPAYALLGAPAALRRRRRRLKGLCIQCGYDLRASGDRCPECGTSKPS